MVSPTWLFTAKGAVSSHSSRTGALLEPATLHWATAAAAGSEHREATSDSISIITDELFHLPAVPPPHTPAARTGLCTHRWPHSRVSSAFPPCPPQEYIYPFFRVENPAEREQLKVPFITVYGIKPESFLQGAGDFVPSIRHLSISPFSIFC